MSVLVLQLARAFCVKPIIAIHKINFFILHYIDNFSSNSDVPQIPIGPNKDEETFACDLLFKTIDQGEEDIAHLYPPDDDNRMFTMFRAPPGEIADDNWWRRSYGEQEERDTNIV